MKIQHWAIIFILIVLPFSVICRNRIRKKIAVMKDETKFNNVIDNATFDAVSQLTEIAEQLEYGKNIPITKAVAEAVADRFFTSMAVNFNLNPIRKIGSWEVKKKEDDYYFGGIQTTSDGTESIKDYFHSSSQEYLSQFVPAVVIIGYDRFFIFSYGAGEYSLQKLVGTGSSAYLTPDTNGDGTLYGGGYTLDNFVTLSLSGGPFKRIIKSGPDADAGTNELKGYVGNFVDFDGDGVDDWLKADGSRGYENPYNIGNNGISTEDFIKNYLPTYTDNLSYIIYEGYMRFGWWSNEFKTYCVGNDEETVPAVGSFAPIDFTKVKQDYIYDFNGNILNGSSKKISGNKYSPVSIFNLARRNQIINIIKDALNCAFNNQNQYANVMGITYKFYLPKIGMDQWNHTIDDISVLSFVQGLPMGYDGFYNSYSLGGARIVLAHNFYAETVQDDRGLDGVHNVYHKWYCKCIPRNKDGTIAYENNKGVYGIDKEYSTSNAELEAQEYPYDHRTGTSYIVQEFLTAEDARAAGYYACSLCM